MCVCHVLQVIYFLLSGMDSVQSQVIQVDKLVSFFALIVIILISRVSYNIYIYIYTIICLIISLFDVCCPYL